MRNSSIRCIWRNQSWIKNLILCVNFMKRFHERRNNLNVQQCTNSTYNRFTVIQIPTVIALTFFLRFFFCLVDSMETYYLEQSNAFEISRLSAMNFKFKKKIKLLQILDNLSWLKGILEPYIQLCRSKEFLRYIAEGISRFSVFDGTSSNTCPWQRFFCFDVLLEN